MKNPTDHQADGISFIPRQAAAAAIAPHFAEFTAFALSAYADLNRSAWKPFSIEQITLINGAITDAPPTSIHLLPKYLADGVRRHAEVIEEIIPGHIKETAENLAEQLENMTSADSLVLLLQILTWHAAAQLREPGKTMRNPADFFKLARPNREVSSA